MSRGEPAEADFLPEKAAGRWKTMKDGLYNHLIE